MTTYLDTLAASLRLPLGQAQRGVLRQITGKRLAVLWSDWTPDCKADIVVVDSAPRLLEVEERCRLLPAEAIIVILMSEHPAFDFLKSRLNCHGVIGTEAPDFPHQIWWGSIARSPALIANTLENMHVVTCVRRDTPEEADGLAFARGLETLGISYTIEYVPSYLLCDHFAPLRSRLLRDAWESTEKPLIWLDPGTHLNLSHIPATLALADFGAIPRPDAQISTSAIYFARGPRGLEILRSWKNLCEEFIDLPAAYLLDAAWATVMAQRPLITAWMPSNEARKANPPALPSFSYPEQRTARHANRTGAPEPTCLIKATERNSADTITLIVRTDTGTTTEAASTIDSAIKAFSQSSGRFSTLTTMIAADRNDVARIVENISIGWLLFAEAGTLIRTNEFVSLSDNANVEAPIFVLPTDQDSPAERGSALNLISSQGLFCSAETIANGYQRKRSLRSKLTLVPGRSEATDPAA